MPKSKTDAYWGTRAALRMYGYHKDADKIADDIADVYIRSTNYINNEMRKIFAAFQGINGISEDEARFLLNEIDLDEVKRFKDIVKQVTDPALKSKLIDIINAPAYAHRIERLERLQADIDVHSKSLAEFELTTTKNHYIDTVYNAYNRTIFDIQKGTGIGFTFAQMPLKRITEILDNNWSGKHFSDRIWGNAADINLKIKKELLTGFMTGRAYRRTAKIIENQFAVGAMQARRLVRTESTYIANMAEIESYKECGIDKYKFVAVLDIRTSDLCQAHDGKVAAVSDAMPGINIPPLHVWCRSTTIAVIDDIVADGIERRARDPVTGKNILISADTTYSEWKKAIDDKHGKGTFDLERNKAINLKRDKEMYGRYQKIIGKENMPKTLADFQKMKYTDSEGWGYTKGLYRYLDKYPTSDKRYYDIGVELKGLGIKKGVCLPPVHKQAFIIADPDDKRDPNHILKRMVERNISDDELRGYMADAKAMFIQWSGKRQAFFSDKGVSILNRTDADDMWIYKTGWTKHDSDEENNKIMGVISKYVK